MTASEFRRTVPVDILGEAPRTIAIEADAAERAALARRFDFVSISHLSAGLVLARSDGGVTARGTVRAALVQSCVASGEPVAEEVEEAFEIEFRPHPAADAPDDEIELGPSELDVVFYDGAQIDIGEAVAETLSLAVEPYPRCPAAEAALREAGVRSEEEAAVESSPFAALKGKIGS